jgi:DegV family protein with EDD domain
MIGAWAGQPRDAVAGGAHTVRRVPGDEPDGGASTVSRVVIVTDSVSDMPPALAASFGIVVVPLVVSFGSESFRPNVTMTTDEFWARMTAPDAPFPTTAACSAGDFLAVFDAAFEGGAESVVCVTVSDQLSATLKAALIARDMRPDREIHVVDSRSASAGEGLQAQMGSRLAAEGRSGAEIAAILEDRKADIDLYVALDTLEYLKRGGRISGARAAVGTLLSFKPIITVIDGVVDNAERVRSRAKARERVLELLTARPLERATVLHSTKADVEEFHARFLERSGLDPSLVDTLTIGASVGPHLGPGCVGAVILYKR